ncbi:hypothetical protein WN51_10863 [Melipona quadrifasciata]|uniref:Uncharacterized protein n=1 Tax=Melipona quadrifasciata TaxID=166423 RepID=A0A0M9A4U3_9HYME|nr:hypothetical protein WN51_10863 [Melipona quadrifasciata]
MAANQEKKGRAVCVPARGNCLPLVQRRFDLPLTYAILHGRADSIKSIEPMQHCQNHDQLVDRNVRASRGDTDTPTGTTDNLTPTLRQRSNKDCLW